MSRATADDILTELIAGAQGRKLDYVVLRAIIEEASEAGARRALASLGLEDDRARRDMDELRDLLSTWRDVRKSAWRTAARWITRVLLATLMVAIAYRTDMHKLLES